MKEVIKFAMFMLVGVPMLIGVICLLIIGFVMVSIF